MLQLHTVIICFLLYLWLLASVISDTLLLALFNIKTVVYILCLAIFCVVVVVVVVVVGGVVVVVEIKT